MRMMTLLLHHNTPFSILTLPSPSPTLKPTTVNNNWAKKALVNLLTGALSFNLLLSSPSSLALQSPSATQTLTPPAPAPAVSLYDHDCLQGDDAEPPEEADGKEPQTLTNQGIVEEAWQIVNDSFLDSASHRWTPENWLRKREDIVTTSIQTRSKAHDLIRRMLASLGDPYTRFLSPAE
ncbi:hypothetical protein Ddye_023534, partial [Dipteronia dyeriana]